MRLCWASAALLSLLPHGGLLIADWGVSICAYPDTEGGHAGRYVLGLGFGALASLLPFGLMASAVMVGRLSYSKGRLLTWTGAGGAVVTAAYYALSVVAFFSPYCPSGSQGLLFVLLLYGGIAGLVLLARTSPTYAGTSPTLERSGAHSGGPGGVQEEQEEGGGEQGGAVPQR